MLISLQDNLLKSTVCMLVDNLMSYSKNINTNINKRQTNKTGLTNLRIEIILFLFRL